MRNALVVAATALSILIAPSITSDQTPALAAEQCTTDPSVPIHDDASISGQMLADVDGDGSRDVLTGYTRQADGASIEEVYLHVEFGSGWATSVRLDTIGGLDANRSEPLRVVVLGGERLILNRTASIAPGSAFALFWFRDCTLAPVPLTTGGYPQIWEGIGPSHSEWPTCRADNVAEIEVGKRDFDSELYDIALATTYRFTADGFVNDGQRELEPPRTLPEWVAEFPDCTSPHGSFVDDEGSVFQESIEWVAVERITIGCNPPINDRYCPKDFVTRGEMAAFLARAFNYTDDGGGNLFADDDASVFESAIDKLKTAGVTAGCNPPVNDNFCPNRRVTRGEMAALLARAVGYVDDGGGDLFTDDDTSIYESAIDKLRTAGVTHGCNPPVNDHFCPDDFVTREQMASFLRRAIG